MTSSETIVLGGGCFWCIEAVYRSLRGVLSVHSGYAGGTTAHPTYEQVCSGLTGHAEVVEVVFDPAVITCRQILQVFFTLHDPTTLNQQGNDVGTQYRSVIFTTSPEQESIAEAVRDEFTQADVWGAPLVTQIEPLPVFWPAEAKHEDYYARNPDTGYCQAVVGPKVAKMRKLFADLQKS
ncbi:peptide-methionine (S)-S-oxide reductase MsrA [Acetobacter estunensis]|uniref:peptide-methionine (S)-S-oxide reductase MsrA n=1 Tax=Acetobacter estunensis TaxID=104097 RepID=UPI001C2D039D|nr:peptide-methionine (S)-S-oxide reductase MsrA [Acetobacter estunensis]MBV1836782.1 peptide-methionine (S)-S-oxide reductase MsrA [Acetobacter estunensis]